MIIVQHKFHFSIDVLQTVFCRSTETRATLPFACFGRPATGGSRQSPRVERSASVCLGSNPSRCTELSLCGGEEESVRLRAEQDKVETQKDQGDGDAEGDTMDGRIQWETLCWVCVRLRSLLSSRRRTSHE